MLFRSGVTDKEVGDIGEYIKTLVKAPVNEEWLLNNTEKFCKDRAVYLAIMGSIKIFEGKDPVHSQDAIPHLLSDALAVSFDSHVGHDYLDDFASRYEFYHRVEEKIPSIIHVDGTCRIQTVNQEQNLHYYNLISEFKKLTGTPVLFNTSFNLGGDPLVETLDDAVRTLENSDLNYLYLPEIDTLVWKE